MTLVFVCVYLVEYVCVCLVEVCLFVWRWCVCVCVTLVCVCVYLVEVCVCVCMCLVEVCVGVSGRGVCVGLMCVEGCGGTGLFWVVRRMRRCVGDWALVCVGERWGCEGVSLGQETLWLKNWVLKNKRPRTSLRVSHLHLGGMSPVLT